MSRSEIAAILARHKGSKGEVARRATPPVKANAVSMWLAGGTNANVERSAVIVANELIEKERQAQGRVNGPSARTVVEDIRKSSSAPSE